jgi:hypothetical protein
MVMQNTNEKSNVTAGETAFSYTYKDCEMSEIKVGEWTVSLDDAIRLEAISVYSKSAMRIKERRCRECCTILGIDPTTDSVAKDIAEEIVLHGTPVDEVIAKLQRHLEGGQ